MKDNRVPHTPPVPEQAPARPNTEGYKPRRIPAALQLLTSKSNLKEEATMQNTQNGGTFVTKGEFMAVGLKWEGTYEEAAAGGIGTLQDLMADRIGELSNVIHPETLLGISYVRKDGFTLYLCFEVAEAGEVPEGMHRITVPSNTYAHVRKTKEQSVDAAYSSIHRFMECEGCTRSPGSEMNIEAYLSAHRCASKEPFAMDIFIPVEHKR